MNATTQDEAEASESFIPFLLDFGPKIGLDPSFGNVEAYDGSPEWSLHARIGISPELLATDDLDRLVEGVGVEVRGMLLSLAGYITGKEYGAILEKHVLSAVIAYRETVLGKGVDAHKGE